MAAKLRLVSDADHDAGEATPTAPRTLVGRPRVAQAGRLASRGKRVAPGQRTQAFHEQRTEMRYERRGNDHTLGFGACDDERPTVPRRAPRAPEPKRAARPDLDLERARVDDRFEGSALIRLSDQHARSRQTWVAFGVGAAIAAVLLALFFA